MEITKIIIKSTGQQGGYGIGSIMASIPASHHKKIMKFVKKYYNAPTMHCGNCDGRVVIDWQFDGEKEYMDGFTAEHDVNPCICGQY